MPRRRRLLCNNIGSRFLTSHLGHSPRLPPHVLRPAHPPHALRHRHRQRPHHLRRAIHLLARRNRRDHLFPQESDKECFWRGQSDGADHCIRKTGVYGPKRPSKMGDKRPKMHDHGRDIEGCMGRTTSARNSAFRSTPCRLGLPAIISRQSGWKRTKESSQPVSVAAAACSSGVARFLSRVEPTTCGHTCSHLTKQHRESTTKRRRRIEHEQQRKCESTNRRIRKGNKVASE